MPKKKTTRKKQVDALFMKKPITNTSATSPTKVRKRFVWQGLSQSKTFLRTVILGVDEDDELIDPLQPSDGKQGEYGTQKAFPEIILENLKTAGVQRAHKEDKIDFTSLIPWPGGLVCAEGFYVEVKI